MSSNNNQIEITEEYSRVLELLKSPEQAIFVTGGAGRGKSVLIKLIQKHHKNTVLVAPHGIGALNIGGSTVHSLFGIPVGVFLFSQLNGVKKEKRDFLKAINVLVIDEVSMLSACMVELIDAILRFARGVDRPFGGLSVVFVGDLLQTTPVIGEDEALYYDKNGYASELFYMARSFEEIKLSSIMLTKPFRQKDPEFSRLLDEIRVGQRVRENLALLNNKCYLDRRHEPEDDAVCLVPTNALAQSINQKRLNAIQSEPYRFLADIQGSFANSAEQCIAPAILDVKIGARVVLTRNRFPFYSNGDTGIVTSITATEIGVKLDKTGQEHTLTAETWEKYKYVLEPGSRQIEQVSTGTFTQMPITLGWAMTVHKSQSLTMDKVNINLSTGAFATGQTYVALSRCTKLEGIRLLSPLRMSDVKVCQRALDFYRDAA